VNIQYSLIKGGGMAKLEEVFGISSKPVLSYVSRPQVDGKFVTALASDRHIVIYGSSKQGKTSLRQKHVPEAECTIIRCSPKSSTESIYSAILRDTGIKIDTIETNSFGAKGGGKTKWGFSAIIPFFGSGTGEAEIAAEGNAQRSTQSNFVGFDLSDAQAVTELLAKVRYAKYVVLENFHYLPSVVQKQIAFDLKTFHEVSVRFVILGIWKEANYLLMHNGDLQDRIAETPVEPWEGSDFDLVISSGSASLNISIDAAVCAQFKQNAYGNIGMLQEFLKTFCRLNGILQTAPTRIPLANLDYIERTFNEKVEDQRGRLTKVLQTIAGRSRTDTHTSDPLILPYYLVRVLLTTQIDELTHGIRRQQLLEKIRAVHHRENKDTIRRSDIANLLKRIPFLQEGVQPPFLYYDNNQMRLKIVDATQFFVLARIEREELWEEIPDPSEKYEDLFADQDSEEG
jgi:hypothetical protein